MLLPLITRFYQLLAYYLSQTSNKLNNVFESFSIVSYVFESVFVLSLRFRLVILDIIYEYLMLRIEEHRLKIYVRLLFLLSVVSFVDTFLLFSVVSSYSLSGLS
ncbi:unnamed protein product [Brassica rapa subsp. narinosa]|uniref:(rape) hypothetical protein n=1 Tax=Brassica napus TaxID=3708 RepID=A0A817B015_BRANA|nr:unnamed protein product [Brassica napus]